MDRKEVIRLVKQFKQKAKRHFSDTTVWLFGSWAEGTPHKDSDVDLIVVSEGFTHMNFFDRCSRMYDYWEPIVPVDFICYTPKEFDERKDQVTIVQHALRHGMPV